jgi:hypothetical protein
MELNKGNSSGRGIFIPDSGEPGGGKSKTLGASKCSSNTSTSVVEVREVVLARGTSLAVGDANERANQTVYRAGRPSAADKCAVRE